MQVCNLFIKILKKNKMTILFYLGIFAFILAMMTQSKVSDPTNNIKKINCFIETEVNDKESNEFTKFLEPYINKIDDVKNIDDSLFWNEIDLYIYVPKGFFNKVLANETDIITIKSTPDSIDAYSLVSNISQYFNLVKENINLNLCNKDNALEYSRNVMNNIEEDVYVKTNSKQSNGVRIFTYTSSTYVVAAIILFIIGIVSFEIRTTDISRRLNISPLSITKRNFHLIISYSITIMLIAAVLFVFIFIFLKDAAFFRSGYFFLNTILYALVMLLMALLLSSLFKKQEAFQCVTVILPLAASFLTGAFVPMEFLSKGVRMLGRIFPTYYINEAYSYIDKAVEFNILEYLNIVWPLVIFALFYIIFIILIEKKLSRREA